jgi:hypothetical protein
MSVILLYKSKTKEDDAYVDHQRATRRRRECTADYRQRYV